jgi:two-component system phosphate regulon sensor histidine kinase PhoR
MTALINDFLSVSKLEMGTFATKQEEVELSEFCSGVADEYAEKINDRQLQLIRKEDPPQLMMKSDPRLLHVIVSNLLSNAVKYTKDSGRVWLMYEQRAERVRITIADNGIGVPRAEQEQLFSKFFRATNAQKHQTEGTGLGLYAVKRAVEMLKGTISVNSKQDEGTTFVVELPL